jgi:hypothetical protein
MERTKYLFSKWKNGSLKSKVIKLPEQTAQLYTHKFLISLQTQGL